MSEELPAILAEPIPAPAPAPAPVVEPVSFLGGVLHAARENAGLNIEDIARKLCLSSRQLAALEADDLRALPSPAFTRGFIRNYARLLNLDPDPLLAAYRDMLPQDGDGNSISLHSEDIPILTGSRKTWVPYLLASILIGVAGGGWLAYVEWSERQPAAVDATSVAKPAATAQLAAPITPEVTPASVMPTEPVVEVAPAPAAGLSAIPPVAQPVGTPVLPPIPDKVGSQLVLHFTQQSWVRISDRDGVEVFSKTKPAGSEEVAEGKPPFKVEIGNAAGVQLSYGGQAVDLAPHTKANVARFVLE